ncbi:3-isopropylmalate dehydrogenase [Niabella terrae]
MKKPFIKSIAVIEGDGIGPEVTEQAVKALNAISEQFSHRFEFDYCLIGAAAMEKTGQPLPEATVSSCLNSDAILMGAIGDPRYDHDPDAKIRPEQGLLQLRKALGLFANIRPVHSYNSLQHLSPLKTRLSTEIDFVIYRELTGGIYFGPQEHNADFASDSCVYHREEIERITELAFKQAGRRNRKLTLIDKANVLETSRLWRRTVKRIAQQYPDIQVDYLFVDNAAMQLIINPHQFDVILTENLFGDILSDEASVLTGSLGMLPSASVGDTVALFEPVHGSYPQAKGKNIANPVGAVLSAAMLLDYLELPEEAGLVRDAISWTLSNGFVTRDINPGSSYSTSDVGDLISDYIYGLIPGSGKSENINLRKSTII